MFERPKSKFEKRNEFIELLTKKLDRHKITVVEFMNQMSSKLYEYSAKQTDLEFLESESSSEESDKDSHNDSEENESLKCRICFQNPRNILLQPCMHYKICSSCFSHLKETAIALKNELLCPFCRQIINKSGPIYL